MITIAHLEPVVLAGLRRHYEEAATAETRTRYHMVLLAQQGQRVPQIARLVERSEDTVGRVLKRFLTQGLEAVPRRCTAKSARAHRDGRLGGREARVSLNWTPMRSARRRRTGRTGGWGA